MKDPQGDFQLPDTRVLDVRINTGLDDVLRSSVLLLIQNLQIAMERTANGDSSWHRENSLCILGHSLYSRSCRQHPEKRWATQLVRSQVETAVRVHVTFVRMTRHYVVRIHRSWLVELCIRCFLWTLSSVISRCSVIWNTIWWCFGRLFEGRSDESSQAFWRAALRIRNSMMNAALQRLRTFVNDSWWVDWSKILKTSCQTHSPRSSATGQCLPMDVVAHSTDRGKGNNDEDYN